MIATHTGHGITYYKLIKQVQNGVHFTFLNFPYLLKRLLISFQEMTLEKVLVIVRFSPPLFSIHIHVFTKNKSPWLFLIHNIVLYSSKVGSKLWLQLLILSETGAVTDASSQRSGITIQLPTNLL